MQIDIVNLNHEKTGTVDLPEDVFGTEVKTALLWEQVKAQRASKRRGTHDTKTRAKGVSIATMVNTAFNAMIAQTTSVALDDVTGIGWRWYILFIVCNFTNAVYFWCVLPETSKRPLEEMRYLFTEAPIFVPTMKRDHIISGDLERRAEEVERKQQVDADEREQI